MNDMLYSSVESVVTENGMTLLGVNLTILPAQLIEPGPQSPTIQPWLWKFSGWAVTAKVNGVWSATAQNIHKGLPADAVAPWAPLIIAVENLIAQAAVTMRKKGSTGAAPSQKIVVGQDFTQTPAVHFYNAMLMNLAATSYPVPQNLNLSFFLEFDPIPNATAYLALPVFSIDGAQYTPTFVAAQNDVWDATVAPTVGSGLPIAPQALPIDMHSEFVSLGATAGQLNSLWLDYTPDTNPLISDWPSHLVDVTAPYLDTSRVMASVTDEALAAASPANWPKIREAFRKALYSLFNPLGLPAYDSSLWAAALRAALPRDFPALNVLNTSSTVSASALLEVADLRALLSGITTGAAPAYLLNSIYATTTIPFPADVLKPENAVALVRLLEVRNASGFAAALAKSVATAATVAAPAQPTMSGVASALTAQAAGPIYVNLASACPEWLALFGTFVKEDVNQALTKDLNRQAYGTESVGSAVTTTQAAPLILPILPLRADANPGGAALAGDPLHGMRGVGVLLRRKSTAPQPDPAWSTLNLASPVVGGLAFPDLAMLVPVRPAYSATLLTSLMPYNNSGFAADDFLHRYLADGDQLAHNDLTTVIEPLLSYAPYTVMGTPLSGVPELRAGATYEGATFAVSNAGALPVALRDPAYPAKYKPLSADANLPGVTSTHPAASVFSLPYFRTVPVGGMEARAGTSAAGGRPRDVFPNIPNTVTPRAGDATPSTRGRGALPAPGDTPGPRPALLLVTPAQSMGLTPSALARSTCSFQLKLPSVEPLTWDRTKGYLLAKADRSAILDTVYRNMGGAQRAEITDPLIASVRFMLYRWNALTPKGSWDVVAQPIGAVPASFSPGDMRPTTGPLAKVETVALHVDVKGGDNGSRTAVCTNGSVILTNPAAPANPIVLADNLVEGEIYLLEAVLVLADTASLMKNFVPPPSSYQLLIEIASAKMPAVVDLLAGFTVTTPTTGADAYQRIDVHRPADRVSVWKNVHRVDFLRQSWSWTGRTQPVIPQDGAQPAGFTRLNLKMAPYPVGGGKPLAEWESIEFAERPVSDHVELSSMYQDGGFHYTQDLSLDLRAMHLRFATRAFSRYEGLFNGDNGAPAWYVQNCVGDSTRPDLWTSCLVKSRVRTLSMPRLKALIPLMESAFVPGLPGVMAVFDGPACNQAGFAETMFVRITEINNPDPASTAPKTLFQAGPDALMNSDAALPPFVPHLIAVGPSGHTLDPDLPGAKFISHSFIIRAVKGTNADSELPEPAHDLSWWFANLEFQLRVDPNCSVYKDVSSEKTPGSWIQFLPGFQDSQHNALLLKDWSFVWNGGRITIYDEKGLRVSRNKDNERHVLHHLLVTRRVRDIAGIGREARYGVAVFDKASSTWVMLNGVAADTPTDQLRVHFLDIRAGEIGNANDSSDPLIPPHSLPTDEADFWRRSTGKVWDEISTINRASADDYRSPPVDISVAILPKVTK